MINLISRKVLRYLLKCGVVDNNEDECSHYLYGIEITISSLLNIFLIMSIGTLLGCIQYSFVFLFVFISLRHMTGGYHAKSYFKCNFSLCVIFVFDIFTAKYIWQYINKTICIIILNSTRWKVLPTAWGPRYRARRSSARWRSAPWGRR